MSANRIMIILVCLGLFGCSKESEPNNDGERDAGSDGAIYYDTEPAPDADEFDSGDPGGVDGGDIDPTPLSERYEPPIFAEPQTCADIDSPDPCVEVSECGTLTEKDTYYLLTQDLSSSGTCLVVIDDITIDLNGYTLIFDEGHDTIPQNGDFEAMDVVATSVAGWDLSAAPGAQVVDHWTMPLVGERSLFVPAGGEVVSDWVELKADRSFRGSMVRRGGDEPVEITVEYQGDEGVEEVCSRSISDHLHAGKAAFCNFHGQPAGDYRIRVRSESDHYIDDAAIVPSRTVGIGAVRYYTSWEVPDRPSHACNLDDGACHLPEDNGGPTTSGGNIIIRNGKIQSGSRGMKTAGIYVRNARLSLEGIWVDIHGTTAQAISAGTLTMTGSYISGDAPWVIDRERSSADSLVSAGPNVHIEDNVFIGGQGNLSISSSDDESVAVVIDNHFINRATVTNHYALNASHGAYIARNTFGCDPDQEGCPEHQGSGILVGRAQDVEIEDNDFYITGALCNAEYFDTVYSTNAIRMTDYNAAAGSDRGVSGGLIHRNRFQIHADEFPEMEDCKVVATGVFYSVGGGDNIFENNDFEILSTSENAEAYAFYIGGADNGGIWRDNEIRSDDRVAWISSAYGTTKNVRMQRNYMVRLDNPHYDPVEAQAPFRVGYCCGRHASGMLFEDLGATGGYEPTAMWFSSGTATPFDLSVKWSVLVALTEEGSPVADASVRLIGEEEVVEGVTDEGGLVTLIATERRVSGERSSSTDGSEEVFVTPHEIEVDGQSVGSVEVTADTEVQIIEL